jgi:hypothetical protein
LTALLTLDWVKDTTSAAWENPLAYHFDEDP